MQLIYSIPFLEDYERLPETIRRRVDKQLRLFERNPRHPSLQTRKLKRDPTGKLWYGRITDDYRFIFEIEGDVFILRRVGKHDEIL